MIYSQKLIEKWVGKMTQEKYIRLYSMILSQFLIQKNKKIEWEIVYNSIYYHLQSKIESKMSEKMTQKMK